MTTRSSIRFLRRGRIVELHDVKPMQTVLDWLRLEEKSKGTKEGCNEGDCGACTVAIGKLHEGKVVYHPANACILLVAQLEGCELVSVDDLAQAGVLHPVQQAMVDHHGSQCGFCTPGFVMALFTLYHAGHAPTRAEIADHIAGNLCRCTGYRPIVDAASACCTGRAVDQWAKGAAQTALQLQSLDDHIDVVIAKDHSLLAMPKSEESLAQLVHDHPDATIIAGATDVGLWITKQMRDLRKVIHVSGVESLHAIRTTADHVSIGAAATYAEAEAALGRIDPDIAEAMRRLGSRHVRAQGTIGGNIANGSPIGDSPPMLIALGAQLHLRHGANMRKMPLEKFFIDYGKQDRKAGELVWQIDVPKLKKGERFRCYKISKRFDQDISSVMAAFKFAVVDDVVVSARLAFGGMAGTPKRAAAAEAAIAGVVLSDTSTWRAALEALSRDFTPLSDMRASAKYREVVARNLLCKALMEIAGASDLRLLGLREDAA
jgi:xanthine dehydrogenase small subunit